MEVRQEALRPAALVGQLGGHLRPAVARIAEQAVVRHERVLEEDLVEVVATRQVDDRPHRDPVRVLQIDDDLAHAGMPLVGLRLRADQRDAVLRHVRVGGPDLRPVEPPAAVGPFGPGADRGQVRTGVRFAHADREGDLATGDRRQETLLLLPRAVAQNARTDLAIGEPVERGRRTRRQQLLGDDIALEVTPLGAAVLPRPGHADEPRLAERAAERRVPSPPRQTVGRPDAGGKRLFQQDADARPEIRRRLRQNGGREAEVDVRGLHGGAAA